jgi:hypothetical protein
MRKEGSKGSVLSQDLGSMRPEGGREGEREGGRDRGRKGGREGGRKGGQAYRVSM